jgi:hypothetical protein
MTGMNGQCAEGASTGSLTLATFTDPNPGDNHADFTGTIHRGDGKDSTGRTQRDLTEAQARTGVRRQLISMNDASAFEMCAASTARSRSGSHAPRKATQSKCA